MRATHDWLEEWSRGGHERCFERSERNFKRYVACMEEQLGREEEMEAARAFVTVRLQNCTRLRPYSLCADEAAAEMAELHRQMTSRGSED